MDSPCALSDFNDTGIIPAERTQSGPLKRSNDHLRDLCDFNTQVAESLTLAASRSKESVSLSVADCQQKTRRFCEMMTSMLPSHDPMSHDYGSSGRHSSNHSQMSQELDMPQVMTLATTYMLIVRMWKLIFTHIHSILNEGNGSQSLTSPLNLQIQMQGYDMQSPLALQAILLCQDVSGRLQVIETLLGLDGQSMSGIRHDGRRDGDGSGHAASRVLISQPMALSVLQIVFAQERQVQGEDVPLVGIMERVKQIIISRKLI